MIETSQLSENGKSYLCAILSGLLILATSVLSACKSLIACTAVIAFKRLSKQLHSRRSSPTLLIPPAQASDIQ